MFCFFISNKNARSAVALRDVRLRGTTQITFHSGMSLKGSNVAAVVGYTGNTPSSTPLASYLRRLPLRAHTNRALSLRGYTAYSSRSKRLFISNHYNIEVLICQLIFYSFSFFAIKNFSIIMRTRAKGVMQSIFY